MINKKPAISIFRKVNYFCIKHLI
jgi:hypothetical protein